MKALSGKRAAILLQPSPAFVVALAAAEGRGAVILAPEDAVDLPALIEVEGIGAWFTTATAAAALSVGIPVVLLDEAPRRAVVRSGKGDERPVDLGSHFPLELEGAADVPGRDEECLRLRTDGQWASQSHRAVIAAGEAEAPTVTRGSVAQVPAAEDWSSWDSLSRSAIGPLLAGAALRTPGK